MILCSHIYHEQIFQMLYKNESLRDRGLNSVDNIRRHRTDCPQRNINPPQVVKTLQFVSSHHDFHILFLHQSQFQHPISQILLSYQSSGALYYASCRFSRSCRITWHIWFVYDYNIKLTNILDFFLKLLLL